MDPNLESSSKFALGEKGMQAEQIFFLPEGYFMDLEERIPSIIFLESFDSPAFKNTKNTPSLQNNLNQESGTPIGFKIPTENYFDTLSTRILSKIDRQESEIEFLDPLLHKELKNTQFSIPEFYFEQLPEKIRGEIDNPESILDNFKLEKAHPFTVPNQYFEEIHYSAGSKLTEFLAQSSHAMDEASVISIANRKIESGLNKKSFLPIRKLGYLKILAAASICLLAVFAGIRIRQSYIEKASFPISSLEDRLKYRFGIDESVLEDELVSDSKIDTKPGSELSLEKKNTQNDQYLLSHPDSNTLLEEL